MPSNSIARTLSIACLAAAFLAGCGGDAQDPSETAKPLVTIDPATSATITGTVTFEGTPPPAKEVSMEADHMCSPTAATQAPEVTQEVVVTDGKLANVFVYLSDGVKGRYAPPAEPAVLDQHGCRYHPHVLGMMVGQPLRIRNSDSTLHNIHAAPEKNKPFNLAQTQPGQTTDRDFNASEVMIPVKCDVHGWMQSYIGVLSHPFFSATGTDGAFSMTGVPPGTYTVTAWHERYGTQQQKLVVAARADASLSFTFKAP